MVALLDLPAVEAAFADWRANKAPRQQIPEVLKAKVVALLAHYKAGLIRERFLMSR